MKHLYRILFVILLLFTSCSRGSDKVITTVDGGKITAKELSAEMSMERGKFDPVTLSQKANLEEFRKQALARLIQEQVLLNEAKRLGIKLTGEEAKEIEKTRAGAIAAREGDSAITDRGIDPKTWQEKQKRRLIIRKLIQREVMDKIPVPDEKINAYYKKNLQEFNLPAQYRARQILVDTRETADEIKARLAKGENFEDLAREYSMSPDGKRGGDLGYFDARMYPEAFALTCQQLKVGETSDVVASDYGFQIFELLDRRPPRQVPFDEAKEIIKQRLREENSEGKFEEWSKGLMAKAKVETNEEALKEAGLEVN